MNVLTVFYIEICLARFAAETNFRQCDFLRPSVWPPIQKSIPVQKRDPQKRRRNKTAQSANTRRGSGRIPHRNPHRNPRRNPRRNAAETNGRNKFWTKFQYKKEYSFFWISLTLSVRFSTYCKVLTLGSFPKYIAWAQMALKTYIRRLNGY